MVRMARVTDWRHNKLAPDKGRRRLFKHMRIPGEQVETLRESGKTIRHWTWEEGQVIWNERKTLLNFKIRPEMTRPYMKQNLNHDRPVLPSNWQSSCAMAQLLMPFHLFPVGNFKALGEKLQRLKRSTAPGGSFDNRVCLDSIGALRSPWLNLKREIK